MSKGDQVNPYLREAVMTATPEQLQLMLYDGAIRFATQARETIEAGHIEKSHHLLTRAQRIVSEMANGLKHEVDPELCGRMAGLYSFVFNKLVDANVERDVRALDDALLILERQRDTWKMLVDKVQEARAEQPADPVSSSPEPPADISDSPAPTFSVEG